jgi:endonuclease/exonuclease/phosphatase family metal-dependent hydrolase
MANSIAVKPGKDFYDKNINLICSALSKASPDIVTLQEIDYDSERSFRVNQPEYIASRLGLQNIAYMPNWNKRYLPFPYWPPSVHYGRVYSGQAVLSGFEIISQKKHALPEPASNSFFYNAFYFDRLLQETVISVDGREIVVVNVHLEAWDVPTREEHARLLLDLYKKISHKPVIILGDFNSPPPYASKLKNFPEGDPTEDYTNDKTISIVLSEKSLRMAIPEERYKKNEKQFFTYSSEKPYESIDHIFYNEKIIPVSSEVINDAGTGSDHLPVYFQFKIR